MSAPHQLEAVPESERIKEEFGWLPASWAFGLAVYCSLLFVQPAKAGTAEYAVSACAAALAGFLIFLEFRRRRQSRVLVRFPQSPEIAIYKRGELARSVSVEDAQLFLRHPGKTWALILSLGAVALGFGVFVLPSADPISRSDRVLAALAALFFLSLAASTVKTRLFCELCLFPYPNKRGHERILVTKKAIPRLFSRRTAKADGLSARTNLTTDSTD